MENTIFVVDNDIPEDVDQYRDSNFMNLCRKIAEKKRKEEDKKKKKKWKEEDKKKKKK